MIHKTHPGSKTNSSEDARACGLFFERHPISMFVYDLKTWAIQEVKTALIKKYGYARDETQALNLKHIGPAQDESADHLFHRADEAIFSSKKAGRNRALPCNTNQGREI